MRMFIITAMTVISSLAAASEYAGSGVDQGLRIGLFDVRGVQPGTRNNLFLKAYVQRDGREFSIYCDRKGRVAAADVELMLECADGEALRFELVQRVTKGHKAAFWVQNILVSGDPALVGEKVKILVGEFPHASAERWNGLKIPLRLTANRRPVWEQSVLLVRALRALVGRDAVLEEQGVKVPVPVAGFSFAIDSAMFVTGTANPGEIEFATSLLNLPGDLDHGYRTETDLAAELRKSLHIKIKK